MRNFANLIKTLDSSNKTSVKVNALTEYFRNASDSDKVWTIAILSHRRPPRPVNTTLLRVWANELANIPLWLFEESYHIVGDLAETIALIIPAPREHSDKSLTEFLEEIYAWMLRRKMQGKITQEILDVETTNAKLTEAGYPGKAMTPAEICNVLGVDGIIGSNFSLSKPMSEGAAIAVAVLGGGRGATNEVNTSVTITDAANKKMIWNFDHKFSGGLGSSASDLVDDLMKQASKKMPYIQK